MTKRFLLTSFATWLREQESNASDDLLAEVSQVANPPYSLHFLRQLPVDISLSSAQVIEQIQFYRPDFVIACGMASKRNYLSIESNATNLSIINSPSELITGKNDDLKILHTPIDVAKLIASIPTITLSHDCGKFVCEGLYYSILDYLNNQGLKTQCIFAHVPILTSKNQVRILNDFLLLIHKLALLPNQDRL